MKKISEKRGLGVDFDGVLVFINGKPNLGVIAGIFHAILNGDDIVIITGRTPDGCHHLLVPAAQNKVPIEIYTIAYWVTLFEELIKMVGSRSTITVDTHYDLLDPAYGYSRVAKNEAEAVQIFNIIKDIFNNEEELPKLIEKDILFSHFKEKLQAEIEPFKLAHEHYKETNKNKKLQLEAFVKKYKEKAIYTDDAEGNIKSAHVIAKTHNSFAVIHCTEEKDQNILWLKEFAQHTGLLDAVNHFLENKKYETISYKHIPIMLYLHRYPNAQIKDDFQLAVRSAIQHNKLLLPKTFTEVLFAGMGWSNVNEKLIKATPNFSYPSHWQSVPGNKMEVKVEDTETQVSANILH